MQGSMPASRCRYPLVVGREAIVTNFGLKKICQLVPMGHRAFNRRR